MRKLLLILLSFWVFASYGQLSEGFEGTSNPNYTTDDWVLGSGTWKVFDNGNGVGQNWQPNALAFEGTRAAFLSRENVASGTAIDWLVTPLTTIPANGQLRFFTRVGFAGLQGSSYTIRVSTASQTTPADFTVIQTWDDDTILDGYQFDEYHQMVVDLTAYAGQNVYIAFVMENDNGDRWFIDTVNVDSQCLDITTQNVSSVGDTSANLGWDNPSGATEWEIEWGPVGFVPGTGTIVSPVTSNPYPLSGLTAATEYDFYVRPNCGAYNMGEWVGPYTFATALCPAANQCEFEFVMTDSFGDGWNGNSMTISQFGIEVATITLANNGPTNGDGPETVTVALCSGEPFEVFWNGGAWTNEVILDIVDPNGTTVFSLPQGSGGQVGTTIYSGPTSCIPPTCPKPTNITVSNLTENSGTVTWSDNTSGNATEWQVVIQPAGSGYPLNGSEIINETVMATTYNFSGLTSATPYEVYVLAVCDAGTANPDPSIYGGPQQFYTLIENDECADAVVAAVNDNTSCLNTVHGSLVGATASPEGNTCGGTDDDDVWFQFTATSETHSISLINVTGSTGDLFHVLYSGSCGSLTQMYCSDPNASTATGLTPGEVYYIRVYSWTGTPGQTTEFDLCIGLPPSCENSTAFCGDTGAGYVYPNSTGVSSYGDIGCLFTTPNPAWFFMQISDAGDLNFQIEQTNAGGNGLDVDFICWGPFSPSEFATKCNELYDFPQGNTTIPNNIVACSYSAAPIENFTINNAQVDDIYVVLITNYSNQPGTVTFNQTGGDGATNCDIVCSLDLGEDQVLCADSYEIVATTTNADSYQWFLDGVLIPGATASTYTAVESGTYSCTIMCDINEVEDSVDITLNPATVPTFTNLGPFCIDADSEVLLTTSSNGIEGTWALNGTTVTSVDTATAGFFDYVFTPNATLYPCSPQVTMTIQILDTCTFNAFATAVHMSNCETDGVGEFFNTTGSGDDAIDQNGNVFTSTDYGTYVYNSGNLILNGAEVKTFKTTTANVCAVNMYYRVYEASATPGPFSAPIPLAPLEDCDTGSGTFPSTGGPCNEGDQKWQDIAQAIDLTQNLPGNYFVQVYYEVIGDNTSASECDGDVVLVDNNMNYFTASFTIQDTISYISQNEECESSNAYITFSGFNPGDVYSVTYNDDTVAMGPANYTANTAGEILISGLNAGTYDNFNFVINGCTIESLTPIVITNFSPSITNVTNNSDICVGEDAVFTIEGTPNFNVSYTVNGTVGTPVMLDASGFATVTVSMPAVGNVDLALTSIYNTVCNIMVANTSTVIVNPLPTVSIIDFNQFTCVGSDASFSIMGTPNATVNYTINGTAGTPVVLDADGNGTIISTAPTSNVELILTSVTDGTTNCVATVSDSAISTFVDVPEPTYTQIDPTCVDPGSIEITNPLSEFLNTANNLFISEITDPITSSNNINYIELYNGTGAAVDLSNYRLKVISNGNMPPACSIDLVGVLNNNGKFVVKLGTGTEIPGVAYDMVFTGCNMNINNNDAIVLTDNADTYIDVWGNTSGTAFTPSNQIGYNYRRIAVGTTLPSTTFDPADWDVTDWQVAGDEDYSNIGLYDFYITDYEYTLSDGTTTVTQTSTTFSNVTAGTYTLVAHDLISNCYSDEVEVTIVAPELNDPITDFSYTTPVCEDNANLLPMPATGFSTGGTYSSTAGLDIDATTGEINVSNSTPGTYTVTYAVAENLAACLNAGSSTFDVVITNATVATFGNIVLCQDDTNTALPTTSIEGYTGTWSAASIDTSTVGMFTYTFTPDAGQCAATGTLSVSITDKNATTFAQLEYCQGDNATLPSTSIEGYTGTWNATSIDTSVAGMFTYTFTPDAGQCAAVGTLSVTITDKQPIRFTGIEVCGDTTINFPTVTDEGYTLSGSWSPSTIDTSNGGEKTYTFTPDDICYASGTFTVNVIGCMIPRGISPNGDGLNDTFDLSNFDVKKLEIFNRYGMKVYSKSDYVNEWSGYSDSGDELPDATYYYVIYFNNSPARTGWVYINRQH